MLHPLFPDTALKSKPSNEKLNQTVFLVIVLYELVAGGVNSVMGWDVNSGHQTFHAASKPL